MSKRKLIKPTAAEDGRISAGIDADPDTHEVTDFSEMKPIASVGRPTLAPHLKQKLISIRVDSELHEAMKASGKGWQTRARAVLREAFITNDQA